jgi:hypothetical protein
MFGRKNEEEQELGFDISEFDKKEQSEIERVRQILEVAEIIKTVARQSKIMPGGSLVTPNIIFATDKRLIIRDPTALGLRAGMDSIPYSQINKVKLQKGAFTSEIIVDVGRFEGDNRKKIQAIPKKKASEILAIINGYIRQSQDVNNSPKTIIQNDDDPLKILKVRFAKGEISKEEYDDMKSALE